MCYVSSAVPPLVIFSDSKSTDVRVDHGWKSPSLTDGHTPFKLTQPIGNGVSVSQSQNTSLKMVLLQAFRKIISVSPPQAGCESAV